MVDGREGLWCDLTASQFSQDDRSRMLDGIKDGLAAIILDVAIAAQVQMGQLMLRSQHQRHKRVHAGSGQSIAGAVKFAQRGAILVQNWLDETRETFIRHAGQTNIEHGERVIGTKRITQHFEALSVDRIVVEVQFFELDRW